MTGKVCHPRAQTAHPTVAIPHAHLCVDHREAKLTEAGRSMVCLLEDPTNLEI